VLVLPARAAISHVKQLGTVIPERANESRECAPDDRLRANPESISPGNVAGAWILRCAIAHHSLRPWRIHDVQLHIGE
jgi:hypothetical protein